MSVDGPPQLNYNSVRSNSHKSRGASSSSRLSFTDNSKINAQEAVEVELTKRNMKVSDEAWKAFKVYQQYDDWSSETEKTDYTYSRLSSYHHKEVIPGLTVRPNLCRSPIKPSSPTSAYDYTAEVQQLRQLQNNLVSTKQTFQKNNNENKNGGIDTVDNSSTVSEQISYYRRLLEFFRSLWTFNMLNAGAIGTSMGRAIRNNSSAFAASCVSIWAWTLCSYHVIICGFAQRWQKLYARLEPPAYGESRSRWFEHSLVWMKKNVKNINTVITNTVHSVANIQSVRTRRYLWLLLLPLLILAAWYLANDNAKDNISHYLNLSDLIPRVQSFHHNVLARLSEDSSYMWQALLNNLLYVVRVIIDFLTKWTAFLLNGIFVTEENSKHFVFGLACSSWKSFKETYFFLSETFLMSFEIITILALGNKTNVDGTEENIWMDSNANGFQNIEEKTFNADSATILPVNSSPDAFIMVNGRIQMLEDSLHAEKMRRSAEEAKVAAAIAEYRQSLLAHRLQADSSLRRCCRWPCQNGLSSSPSMSDYKIQSAVSELEAMVAAMRHNNADQIEQLRGDIKTLSSCHGEVSVGSFNVDQVKRIVKEAIKIYDSDKTGRADYALETAGGRVVSIRCTKTYSNAHAAWRWLPALWPLPGGPEEAIRPGVAPGQCWAFQGAVGQLALELSYPIHVTGITVEHIAKALSPSGTIDSAPQHFSVWGLKHAEDLTEQYLLGEYVYRDNGETIQYFPVQNPSENLYKFVELKIISNHGHPDYTCLYRIRVHGTVT